MSMATVWIKTRKRAVEYYQKAADMGDASATVNLGVMYEYGNGVDKDPKRAVECYQTAADMGDARGQAYLAIMYRDGNGVQKDYAKAVEYSRWRRSRIT